MVSVRRQNNGQASRFNLFAVILVAALLALFKSVKNDTPDSDGFLSTNIFTVPVLTPNALESGSPHFKPKQGLIWPPASSCHLNLHYNRRPILSLDHVRNEVETYLTNLQPQEKHPDFTTLGRRLLYRAMVLNQTLLTFQIGGMDGVSNDPMYRMYLRQQDEEKESIQRNTNNVINSKWPTAYWMPIVVEGNSINYKLLSQNYRNFQKQHAIPCMMVEHWAVSYNNESHGSNVCDFCRFDVSETALPLCKNQPAWLQTQVGTVNCNHSKKAMGNKFDACVVREQVNCGSVFDFLCFKHGGFREAASRIAILQIDTEGYEGVLLPKLLTELLTHHYDLPPVIHFESKILRRWRRKRNNRQLEAVHTLLRANHYHILEGIEDDLAIQAPQSYFS